MKRPWWINSDERRETWDAMTERGQFWAKWSDLALAFGGAGLIYVIATLAGIK